MLSLAELKLQRQGGRLSDRPAEVAATIRSMIAADKMSSAGAEQWDLYEQGLIAALIISDDGLALV
jgi:hypothetical protein